MKMTMSGEVDSRPDLFLERRWNVRHLCCILYFCSQYGQDKNLYEVISTANHSLLPVYFLSNRWTSWQWKWIPYWPWYLQKKWLHLCQSCRTCVLQNRGRDWGEIGVFVAPRWLGKLEQLPPWTIIPLDYNPWGKDPLENYLRNTNPWTTTLEKNYCHPSLLKSDL